MTKYKTPPIQEALIDLRVDRTDFDEASINALFEKIKENFPIKEPKASFEFNFGPEGASTEEKGIEGYLMRSSNGNKVLNVSKQGFTFSMLNNYDEWPKFYEEMNILWQLFKTHLKPKVIQRVGVRFINKLVLPISEPSLLPEYLDSKLTFANIEDYPQEFLLRYTRAYGSLKNIVTQAVNFNIPNPSGVDYILDIDVFSEAMIETGDNEKLKKLLDSIRPIKNKIFEDSITKKTRSLLNE